MGLVPVGRMNMMCVVKALSTLVNICVCVCVYVCVYVCVCVCAHTEECARGAQKLAGLVCQGTRED